MNATTRRALALVAVLATPCCAVQVHISKVPALQGHLSPVAGAALGALPGRSMSGPALLSGAPHLAASLPAAPAVTLSPLLSPSLLPAAPMPVAAQAESLQETLEATLSDVARADSIDASGVAAALRLDTLYTGGPQTAGTVDAGPGAVNEEGIRITGRAADYYKRIQRLIRKWEGKIDLAESLDVMGDSYGDVWAKIKAIEALGSRAEHHNTHLERTLTWVDGVTTENGRRKAIHTYRTYFHPAENPQSEIQEGIRRADKYLMETIRTFQHGGKAEKELGRFDEVLLTFDARGYDEIKEHLRGRERRLREGGLTRYKFLFLDEMTEMPADDAQLKAEFNDMAERYRGQGIEKIMEGVTYGRYVGLLLELVTVDYFAERGYEILQSGRDLFDENGLYVTELDAAARAPDGRVLLIEAKSARVPLPFHEVLQDKVVAKLKTYSKHRELIERSIGRPIDEVVFSFDIGMNRGLEKYLREKEADLSETYGFPVRFLFLKDGGGRVVPPAQGPRRPCSDTLKSVELKAFY